MANSDLTAQTLREHIHYDPDTGYFKRLTYVASSPSGERAGWNTRGYTRITLLGKRYYAHRLAWFYVTGQWPKHTVDHMDGNRSNNRFSNLRDIPGGAQQQNFRRPRKDSESGFLGVSRHRDKYAAHIRANGRSIYIGTFPTPEEAQKAYLETKRKLHPYGTL